MIYSQSIGNVSTSYNASCVLSNSKGTQLSPKNNQKQSYIIFCQYRAAEESPDGASIYSLKISDIQAKPELIVSIGSSYPIIGVTTSYNVYVKRSNGSLSCNVDITLLKTR